MGCLVTKWTHVQLGKEVFHEVPSRGLDVVVVRVNGGRTLWVVDDYRATISTKEGQWHG